MADWALSEIDMNACAAEIVLGHVDCHSLSPLSNTSRTNALTGTICLQQAIDLTMDDDDGGDGNGHRSPPRGGGSLGHLQPLSESELPQHGLGCHIMPQGHASSLFTSSSLSADMQATLRRAQQVMAAYARAKAGPLQEEDDEGEGNTFTGACAVNASRSASHMLRMSSATILLPLVQPTALPLESQPPDPSLEQQDQLGAGASLDSAKLGLVLKHKWNDFKVRVRPADPAIKLVEAFIKVR
jgi:hypothetical protein